MMGNDNDTARGGNEGQKCGRSSAACAPSLLDVASGCHATVPQPNSFWRVRFARMCALVLFVPPVISCLRARAGESPSPVKVERLTRSSFPKFFLQYSPDGSHIAYCRHHENRRASNKILVGARVV